LFLDLLYPLWRHRRVLHDLGTAVGNVRGFWKDNKGRTHVVEETFAVVIPGDTREFDEADNVAQSAGVICEGIVNGFAERVGSGSNIDS